MSFIEALKARGLVQDMSDEKGLSSLKAGDSFYAGFDPTAPSLQLGNLVPIIVSLHLAKAGLKPIILFGGATGAIGDPSGKSAERQLLERSTIDDNISKHQKKVKEIFARVNAEVSFVNNFDWTNEVKVLDFLRDIGKHFTVNYMISKEVVKTRLNAEGISFTEFSYMILQANDFYHLYKNNSCKLQIGGSDQWGNITAGLELIRRKIQGDAYAFSIPLITDSQGKKFGKSEGGAVWLDAAMTSPYTFHQFWLNIADADVAKYLRIFTFLSESEISELEALTKSEPEKRKAQTALANEVCNLVHGEAATQEALRSAQVLFGGSTDGLSAKDLEEIFKDAPSSEILVTKLQTLSFTELLVETSLSKSKGEAKRLIESGGAYLNNERVGDINLSVASTKVCQPGMFVLRSGKKNYHLVKVKAG